MQFLNVILDHVSKHQKETLLLTPRGPRPPFQFPPSLLQAQLEFLSVNVMMYDQRPNS